MDLHTLLKTDTETLCSMADKVRKDNVGDIVHIRALLEISNICYRGCDYCGLRCDNKNLDRYKLEINEIESLGKMSFDNGYKTIVLQSGENKSYDIIELAEMIFRLTEYGITVTLSLGELAFSELKLLREAGAKRYLLKFETADSKIYSKLHKGYTLAQRLDCLREIRELGYEVGSGFLVGLPDESEEIILKNLELLKELECDMAGIGVFIPHKDTPLKDCVNGSVDLTKKCVAITRLLLPKCNIPITTSLGEFGNKYQMFSGGANVIMQNITPTCYAKNYQIYPKSLKEINLIKDRENLEKEIIDIGRIPN